MELSREDRADKPPKSQRGAAASFDQRLAQAESRLGRDPSMRDEADASSDQEAGKSDMSLFGFAARIGTEMVAALVVGALIGYGLDRLLGFRALFLVIFALVGGAAGTLNVLRAVKQVNI